MPRAQHAAKRVPLGGAALFGLDGGSSLRAFEERYLQPELLRTNTAYSLQPPPKPRAPHVLPQQMVRPLNMRVRCARSLPRSLPLSVSYARARTYTHTHTPPTLRVRV